MNKLLEDNEYIKKRIKKIVTIRHFEKLIVKIILILFFIFLVNKIFFGFYRMKDNSMNPSIQHGELIIYYRLEKEYSIGDVVVYSVNGKNYVGRIVAIAGQVIDIDEKGNVFIDEHAENFNALYSTVIPDNSEITIPYRVPINRVFILQDYRNGVQDSRTFGGIEIDKIEGKVISTVNIRDI